MVVIDFPSKPENAKRLEQLKTQLPVIDMPVAFFYVEDGKRKVSADMELAENLLASGQAVLGLVEIPTEHVMQDNLKSLYHNTRRLNIAISSGLLTPDKVAAIDNLIKAATTALPV